MNKRELLDNMRGRVADIRDGMSKVEENLYVISDCIDEKKFLSPETTGSVRENLEKIEEASAFCRDQYEQLSGDPFEFDRLNDLETSLDRMEVVLSNRETVYQAKRFLALTCADEEAVPALEEAQGALNGIVGDADTLTLAKDDNALAGMKKYSLFMKAYDEEHMINVLDYIPKLRENFADSLVAALLDKKIDCPVELKSLDEDAPAVEIPVEEEAAEPETEIPVDVEEAEEPAVPVDVEEVEEPAVPVDVEEAEAPEAEIPVDVDEPEEPAVPVDVEEVEAPEAEIPVDVDEPEEPAVPVDVEEAEAEIPVAVEDSEEPEIPTDIEEPEEEITIPVNVEEGEEPDADFPIEAVAEEPEAEIPTVSEDEPEEPEIALPADAEEPVEAAIEIPIDGDEIIEAVADDVAEVAEDVAEAADDIAEVAADAAEEAAPVEPEKEADAEKTPEKKEGGFFSRWF
ncbi:MAG: hypothetical protein IK055_10705 [Lachnospiraceae bacterium]|nr:hypothetical protein [Lachnospiraceae bacterium]